MYGVLPQEIALADVAFARTGGIVARLTNQDTPAVESVVPALLDVGARIVDCRGLLLDCTLPADEDEITVEHLVRVADLRIEAQVIGHGAASRLGAVTLDGPLTQWVASARTHLGQALQLLR